MVENAAYVKVILPDNIVAEESPEFPLRSKTGKDVEFIINIKTAKILEWNDKLFEADYLWCKASNKGTYILYDDEMHEIDKYTGDVPNELIPEHDGNGEYIDMKISAHGYVLNWYNKPSFKDFD